MNICLDMMGGDHAPVEAMKGVREYLSSPASEVNLLLTGDESQ